VSPHLLTAATDKIKQLIWALLLSEHWDFLFFKSVYWIL
jgi:hypothetical protein